MTTARCLAPFLAAAALTAQVPSSLYIVSPWWSDDTGPEYRIVELHSHASGSQIRSTRVLRSRPCNRVVVTTVEALVPAKPETLVPPDLCAWTPAGVASEIEANRAKTRASWFSHWGHSVVSQCGGEPLVLSLRNLEEVGIPVLIRRDAPHAGPLSLEGSLLQAAFGPNDPLGSVETGARLDHQDGALEMARRILAGAFDIGLNALGDNAGWLRRGLERYRSPTAAAVVEAAMSPVLVEAEKYRFETFVLPQRDASGVVDQVELSLEINPETGKVTRAAAVGSATAHADAAIRAASQWVFHATAIPNPPLRVVIDFAPRCP